MSDDVAVMGLGQEILNKLAEEFPPEKLDQIQAKWDRNKQLTVVRPEAIIRRLNDVLAGDVDFTIVDYSINKHAGQCIAHMRVTAKSESRLLTTRGSARRRHATASAHRTSASRTGSPSTSATT